MISIRVDSQRDPKVLAELISQAHGAHKATLVSPETVAEIQKEVLDPALRPSREELDTVNFQRLDTENDWTDL